MQITYDETQWEFKKEQDKRWHIYLFGARMPESYSTKHMAMLHAKAIFGANITFKSTKA